jgi:DNA recombination-dependent growth factor C
VANAFGDLIEKLEKKKETEWKNRDREKFKDEVLNSPDPLSLFRKQYDLALLPFSKETIREALAMLIAHPEVEEDMKSRLRVGLLSLDEFVESPFQDKVE